MSAPDARHVLRLRVRRPGPPPGPWATMAVSAPRADGDRADWAAAARRVLAALAEAGWEVEAGDRFHALGPDPDPAAVRRRFVVRLR